MKVLATDEDPVVWQNSHGEELLFWRTIMTDATRALGVADIKDRQAAKRVFGIKHVSQAILDDYLLRRKTSKSF